MSVTVFNLFTGDGTTTDFQYTFDVLGSFSSVIVKLKPTNEDDFVTQSEGTQSEGGHYTVDSATATVTFNTPPASGDTVRIERSTTRTRLIDYVGGATITESNLDNDPNRLTSVDQEIESSLSDKLGKTADGTDWDAEGVEVVNGSPATSDDSLPILSQVKALVEGAEIATITGSVVIAATGDGSTVDFELTNLKSLNTSQVFCFIDGVYQGQGGTGAGDPYDVYDQNDSLYPSVGTGWDYVSFDEAPPNNAAIRFVAVRGTFSGQFADDIITTDMLGNGIVTAAKINVGAGADKRFLVSDTAGDMTARVAVHGDVSDFDAGVRENRLNQMAAPTASVGMNAQKITSLATPSSGTDAATKSYVDGKAVVTKASSGSMNDLNSTGQTRTVSGLGYRPEVIWVTGKWNYSGDGYAHYGTWGGVWNDSSGRAFDGPVGADGTRGPRLTLNPTSDGFTVTLTALNGAEAPVEDITYWAMKR